SARGLPSAKLLASSSASCRVFRAPAESPVSYCTEAIRSSRRSLASELVMALAVSSASCSSRLSSFLGDGVAAEGSSLGPTPAGGNRANSNGKETSHAQRCRASFELGQKHGPQHSLGQCGRLRRDYACG